MAKRNKENNIKFPPEKKEYMLSEIKSYYQNERNEEIGDLAAILLLDFIVEKLAPEFYNQGIADAYKYIDDRLDDVFSIQL